MSNNDPLKKPVHIALLKTTHLEKLAELGKIQKTPYGLDPGLAKVRLPKEPPKSKFGLPRMELPKLGLVSKTTENNVTRTKLRMVHDRIPPLPKDKQPPCSTCKTSACCRAFIVSITEMEYESGIYGDAAIKLTPEMTQQLTGKFVLPLIATGPRPSDAVQYYLDGKIGEPCPFLLDNNQCGIYENRPITCRTYTCVGDSRITQEMRDGTVDVYDETIKRTFGKK